MWLIANPVMDGQKQEPKGLVRNDFGRIGNPDWA